MLMSREAMMNCFLHAAVQASNLWLDHLAVPENVSTPKASRSMEPRSTKRSQMVRSISPFSFFTHFHVYTYLEVMMFDALAISCILKQLLSNHVLSSVKRAFDMFSGFA
eukprot:5129214-Pyramimonas_sp.AAC.1